MKFYASGPGWYLMHGDAFEVLVNGIASFDVTLTDPPYSHAVVTKTRKQGKRARESFRPEDGIRCDGKATCVQPFEFQYDGLDDGQITAFGRLIAARTRRWIGVFSDIESAPTWRAALVTGGARYIRTCAWVKPGSAPQFTGDRPAQGWEPLTLCHGGTGKLRWNGGGHPGVWTYPPPRKPERLIGGQKPEALMSRLIELFTDPGEEILDPFAGAGTTLVCAIRAGRDAFGIEVREEACEQIARRMDNLARAA